MFNRFNILNKNKATILFGNILILSYLNKKNEENRNLIRMSEPRRKIYTWGNGIHGQLGTGEETMNQNIPVEIIELSNSKIKKIYAAFDNSAVLTDDNEFLVWGKTRDGSIGAVNGGGTLNITVPALFPYSEQIEGKIKEVSISREHGGLVTEDGKLYTWGIDLYDKLGHQGNTQENNPKNNRRTQPKITYERIKFDQVNSLAHEKIVDVKCGYNHTLCLSADGAVYSWGFGKDGTLGQGKLDSLPKPTKINFFSEKNIKIEKIASGMNYCLALSTDKKLYAWGKNEYGQLGLGNKTQQIKLPTPQLVPLHNLKVENIFAGEDHCALISSDNEAFIWGYGLDGRLANKKKANSNTPIKIELEGKSIQFAKVSCGGHHTAMLTKTGDLYMCGNGRYGELGNGDNLESTAVSRNEPVFVQHFRLSDEKVLDVECGSSHAIAVVEKSQNGVSILI